jgi:hypothetical protein
MAGPTDYLYEEPEVGETLPPPVATLASELPLQHLSWPDFERLCLRLAERLGDVEHAQIYGTPGQNQKGIDIYARLADGDYYVFQCRRTKRMGPANITQAVSDFLASDWAGRASTFVLCAVVTFTQTQRADRAEEEAARLRERGKVFLPWGRDKLSESLRTKPDLVRRFFGEAWELAFCGPPSSATSALALPQLWEVREPTRTFGYRDEELAAISDAAEGTGAAPSVVVLHGLGGVGKTQLAAGWARLHRDDFNIGWWVAASDEATTLSGLAQLAAALGVADADDDERASLSALRARLSSEERWLLVFDDFDDVLELPRLIPQMGRGTVLVTSRRHGGWRGVGAIPLAVGLWTVADAVSYLVAASGDEDDEAAEAVAVGLDRLPLAIAQAGAYVDETGTSLAAYRKLLVERAPDLLAAGRAPDYEATVRTTWLLAFDEVDKTGPVSTALLAELSYLAPSRVPRPLLQALAAVHRLSPVELDEALSQVLRFSLVQPDGDGVSMHALVGLVARELPGERNDERAAMAAATAVLTAMPSDFREPSTWPIGAELLPHALAAAGHIERLPRAWHEAVDLLHRSASYLTAMSDLRRAANLFEREHNLLADTKAKAPLSYARFLNDYGIAVRDLGELRKARQLLRLSLELKERSGANPLLIASSADNLGQVEQRLGELEAAHALRQRALDLYANELGEQDPLYALQLSNLGTLRLDENDPAGAREDFVRALEIIQDAPGDRRRDEAIVRGNLGNALQDLGDAEGAMREQERTLRLKQELFEAPHLSLADTLGNLGTALLAAGDPEAAAARQRESLEMTEQLYGPVSPGALRSWHNLANALEVKGDEDGAREARARASELADELELEWPPPWLAPREE